MSSLTYVVVGRFADAPPFGGGEDDRCGRSDTQMGYGSLGGNLKRTFDKGFWVPPIQKPYAI